MFRHRLLTALGLGGVFLGALYGLSDPFWALFLLVFVVIGATEWSMLAGYGSRGRILFPVSVMLLGLLLLPGMAALDVLRHAVLGPAFTLSAAFWLACAPLWLLHGWQLHNPVVSGLVGWLLLLAPWLALIQLRHIGAGVVLTLVTTVWIADSAAYFVGKRFGRHKLAPQISPGKTWEGVCGGLLAVTMFASALALWRDHDFWLVVGLLAVAVLSVIGDLFESMIKRQAGMKDSGTLLPGHGGVLDRIDGLTSTLPLAAFYAYFPILVHP